MIFHWTYNKPILLVGNGVRAANAVDLVYEFIKKTNIPVLTTMNAVDIMQDKYHIGFIGTHGNRVANMILNECDLIITIGARLGIRQVGKDNKCFAPNADLLRVDIDEYELARTIKHNEKKIQMDAYDFLTILLKENIPNYYEWLKKCLKAKEYLVNFDITEGNMVVKKISSILEENPIVALDVGQNQCWAAQSLHLKGEKGRIHISGGYGTMGCGLPYAIGSAIACKNRKVYCISGDGGFQMNIQELETIYREKLPIKIFILNNHVLGKISETQHFNHNDRFAQTTSSGGYSVPNFTKIAIAYGIKAFDIFDINDLDMYKDLLNDNIPCLFNIQMSSNSFLMPKIKFETGIICPKISNEDYLKVLNILK